MNSIKKAGYSVRPFSANRRLISASLRHANNMHTIHATAAADITRIRTVLRESKGADGRPLSLTAYVTVCFSRVLEANPQFTAFRKGSRLIVPDDVSIGVLVEKKLDGESVPENIPLSGVQNKSFAEISDEIRSFQRGASEKLGEDTGMGWINLIPPFLLNLFIRIMSQNIRVNLKFGHACVSAVGMFAPGAGWFFPVTSATSMVTIGGIERKCIFCDGRPEEREMLCLTLSFDHDIIDGAPAARFIKDLVECIEDGRILQ